MVQHHMFDSHELWPSQIVTRRTDRVYEKSASGVHSAPLFPVRNGAVFNASALSAVCPMNYG
jgi:hypothetical protein